LSLVFGVGYVGSGLCGELITRSEESYRASVCVIYKPQRGGLGPIWAVAPEKENGFHYGGFILRQFLPSQ
jgi:hypothetical protein